jgi:type IV pilus assembly protein PilZ
MAYDVAGKPSGRSKAMIGAGGARQGILSLAIKDKAQLYGAYMPYVRGGGIFIPTTKRYALGDEVFLLLSLLEDKDRLPVAGKVVWVTPPGSQGNRAAGIGVQFADSTEAETVKGKIETLLAGMLESDKPTHTM